jgi:hypothetical protein
MLKLEILQVNKQQRTSEQAAEDIKERLGEQENLGLTKKEIRELETILEDINDETADSGDEAPGNSADAPGQNKADSGDEAPGNSADAPGQNKADSGDEDNTGFESPEDIPGFGSASDIGKESGQGNGLGLGNIPPGLAKLFGLDQTGDNIESEAPGNSGEAPGQFKNYNDYTDSFEQSPDDFYQMSHEQSIQDDWEATYDGTNRGNGDGKGKFGGFAGKTGSFGPAPGSVIADEKSGGKKPFCSGKALGGKPIILLNGDSPMYLDSLVPYVEPEGRACNPGVIEIDWIDVSIGGDVVDETTDGAYNITYDVTGTTGAKLDAETVTRTVFVGDMAPTFDVNGNTIDFITTIDLGPPHGPDDQYHVGVIQNILDNGSTVSNIGGDYNATIFDGVVPGVGTYTVIYTVTDDSVPPNVTTVIETVNVS